MTAWSTSDIDDRFAVLRSAQFIRIELVLSIFAVATVVTLQLSVGPAAAGYVVLAAFSSTVVVMWWCLRRLNGDNVLQTVLIATAALWVPTLIVAPLIPFGLPIMSFPMVIPLLMAGPLLDRRQLVWFILAAGAATGCVAALALAAGTSSLEELIDERTKDSIIISTFAMRAVTISLAAWDASARRDATLAAAATARDALRASRARLVDVGDEQRRALERNLHDGAQQHLIALAMRLRMMGGRHPDLADEIAPLVDDAQTALDEVREVAHGIFPPLLERGGLAAALSAAARRQPLEVELDVDTIGRCARPVEAAVYYCCLEALQNAAKYAGTDARVTIAIAERDTRPAGGRRAPTHGGGRTAGGVHARVLDVTIADDGLGFEATTTAGGRGLQNIADRTAAIGATATVESSPGRGTVVRLVVPLDDPADQTADAPAPDHRHTTDQLA